ncbi:hypothetical protein I302_108282 [Kwoniella bestiolae CBS 10118]|uniref:Uncharacterized protein n=1 Tax=Kwoniella bestiolae CBS 10118 TaxID=1296100 RepID=A0A1B9FW65_9TREE|nr:hypothetical protein I302_07350 [Kwoniella bestiolae CBS 10118]OCF23000.1 hypothetical protein I302_07350 [Kwoniella bestiolae CBS 10118]
MSQTILDDASEFFQYGGDNWGVDHKKDPFTPQYQEETFHTTTVHMAWSRICWEGTKIKIHGAKRDNHGLYAVSVDNSEPELQDGYSKKEQIKADLYVSQDLEWDVDFATIDGNPISCDGLPEVTAVSQDPQGASPSGGNSTSSISSSAIENTTSTPGTIPAFTVVSTTVSTVAVTTTSSAIVSPTTTVQLSSTSPASVSNITDAGASASSTGASSAGHRLVPGFEGQLALAVLAGHYIFKLFAQIGR